MVGAGLVPAPTNWKRMKRHASLFPLSHDHHHALVEARRLRLGEEDEDAMTRRFLEFWERDLERHFKQEEEIVLPLLATHASRESPVGDETLKQHADIRWMIDAMMKESEPRGDLLRSVGDAITAHIRFEENNLFPVIEAALPEDVLWEMNRRLTRVQNDD